MFPRRVQCLMVSGLLATSGVAHAQKPSDKPKATVISTDHLRIQYASQVTAQPDGSVSFVVEMEPRRGMHVYAPGAGDYQVITLAIDDTSRVRSRPLKYPASEVYLFQPLNEKIPVYQKPFTMTLDAVVPKAAEPFSVMGRLDYQACDDKVCFAPVSVPLRWTVRLDSRAK